MGINKNLEEIGHILNSEGMILGLFRLADRFYLASYLKKKGGYLYFSVAKDDLLNYIKGNITLESLFNLSTDYFEMENRNVVVASGSKEALKPLITLGSAYYNQLSEGFKSPNLEQQILTNEI